jgi:hypothetical protein
MPKKCNFSLAEPDHFAHVPWRVCGVAGRRP